MKVVANGLLSIFEDSASEEFGMGSRLCSHVTDLSEVLSSGKVRALLHVVLIIWSLDRIMR